MKLLVGRFVLMGCISAVLAVADVKPMESFDVTLTPKISIVDIVTEKVIKSSPEVNQRIELSETTSSPDKNTKIFSNQSAKANIEREIVVIRDESSGGVGGGEGHHEHGHHDHQGYHENDHHHHEHDYHHPPPARPTAPHHHHDHHHHPPPPPPMQHHQYPPSYSGYYPPYAPYAPHGMHHPYAAGAAMPPPPYGYYPPANYYNSPPKKTSATIIQTSSTTNGQNYPKPTDLINQGTEYLWNLFGKFGALTGENHHEVVLINPKPVTLAVGSGAPAQMLPPSWYANANKGKIIQNNDCNNKNE